MRCSQVLLLVVLAACAANEPPAAAEARAGKSVELHLAADELLLEFTLTDEVSLLYVASPDRTVRALELPTARPTLQRALPSLMLDAQTGPAFVGASREVFDSLIPRELWPEIQKARRVFIVPHRALHRLPFELLVADVKDGEPVTWLDAGPPIAYLPSASLLRELRTRTAPVDAAVPCDVLAVATGDRCDEAKAIAACARRGATVRSLLDAHATEAAVFESARTAKCVHFACDCIAEEHAGQSLGILVLTRPTAVAADDNGLLKLTDLFNTWRGQLSSCELVVLSGPRTGIGPTLRDEAPQALPLGFLFAGARAVIASSWAIDDASTKELMTDFYSRLLAGETDKLAAFTAAKKALRQKYPDPFHWAPFLYIGAPE